MSASKPRDTQVQNSSFATPKSWEQRFALGSALLLLGGILLVWWIYSSVLRYERNVVFTDYLEPPSYRERDSLIAKQNFYLEHATDYDILFLGDSRTYCGLHPEYLDPLLGKKSINLATFAHWFPTQYPQYLELLQSIPAKTTVVWSIGSQNFAPIHQELHKTYPISLTSVSDFLKFGFSWKSIQSNVISGLPGGALYSYRKDLRARVDSYRNKPFSSAVVLKSRAVESVPSPLFPQSKLRGIEVLRDSGQVTSRAYHLLGGGYLREELDPIFFREKQKAHFRKLDREYTDQFEIDESYWALFLAILDLFLSAEVNLIVSEFAEAPAFYANQDRREQHEAVMKHVARELKLRNISFIRPDWSLFQDTDYFDYNHLNDSGVRKFSPLFAKLLLEEEANGV